jgi:uncharacterized membrane protein YedE/YeeE
MIEFISQPWPWYVAGPVIAMVMMGLVLFGKSFGISANMRTLCSALGAGKSCEFFDFDWKAQTWNLVFVVGLVLGGYIAAQYLSDGTPIGISEQTRADLVQYGLDDPGAELVPASIFNWQNLASVQGILMLVLGGFLVGFGTRYAGGCTSGHAISGLSELQLPSLIAVVGFFIGGLFISYLILPLILGS